MHPSTTPTTNPVLDRLETTLRQIGQPSGQISPAIYDSAYALIVGAYDLPKALRVCAWLVEQQHADGGWADPSAPYARTTPSMAALIALHTYREHLAAEPFERGLEFLRGHMAIWDAPLHDGIPIAAELILPHLVELAALRGLELPQPPAHLARMGEMRRKYLAGKPIEPGAAALFSWEAWGGAPEAAHLDPLGSVCSSPAATLAWVKAAAGLPHLQAEVERAQSYLCRASLATGDVPGLLPNIWPIDNYELSFVLWTLEVAGLLRHPRLEPLVAPLVARLRESLRPDGVGANANMAADGDDTAVTMVVLGAWDSRPTDLAPLDLFRRTDHFASYHGEIQPSVTCTAHALHALRVNRAHCDPRLFDFLLDRQSQDGLWRIDKWHVRWSYITSQVLMVLDSVEHALPVRRALAALAREQHSCGGWGACGPHREETAYIVLALRYLERTVPGSLGAQALQMLERAVYWLRASLGARAAGSPCWMGKEVYHPSRLALLIELAAALPAVEAGETVSYARSA
jgi:hypothetical protein